MGRPTIAAILPTFNEVEVLREAVASLIEQGYPDLTILVINAGKPLPEDLTTKVEEVKVSGDHFWTASIKVGFDIVRQRGFDYVLMANADTTLMPGSVERLLDVASQPNTVAACPGYMTLPNGEIELLYSHEAFYPTLLHARVRQAWSKPEEAPEEPYETPITGGQGVMFKAELLKQFDVDPQHFPQAKGDHDLWLSMRSKGIRIMVVPKAGAVNLRGFGADRLSRKKRLKKLWSRATAATSNDSWRVMWHLRRKHQPLPLATLSFCTMYPWRLLKGVSDALKTPVAIIDETTSA